ncbi:hypothetical protein LWI29_005256 [Acer saccharum]|uniref:Cytochrome P450 n=1 Tax=Acer saccharum TaxID=4024 RepID=A0AA39TLD0_ACESA|nr:hypothetical protein LWI29_005256 [Acer saccharum]
MRELQKWDLFPLSFAVPLIFVVGYEYDAISRPPLEASKYISYDQKNFSFAQYGSYWRTVRKLCTLELLSNLKINAFKSMRKEELDLLIDYVKEAASSCTAVDLSAKLGALSADVTCRMVFGKKYLDKEFDERGFKTLIQEGMALAAIPNMGDYIPQIASLDLQGLTKKMKAVSKVFDGFFEKIIDEHVQSKDDDRTKDFVDVMLEFMGSEETEYRIDREHIKAIILVILYICSLIARYDNPGNLMEGLSVVYNPRGTNSLADNLAKMGSNMIGDKLEWGDIRVHVVLQLV